MYFITAGFFMGTLQHGKRKTCHRRKFQSEVKKNQPLLMYKLWFRGFG